MNVNAIKWSNNQSNSSLNKDLNLLDLTTSNFTSRNAFSSNRSKVNFPTIKMSPWNMYN